MKRVQGSLLVRYMGRNFEYGECDGGPLDRQACLTIYIGSGEYSDHIWEMYGWRFKGRVLIPPNTFTTFTDTLLSATTTTMTTKATSTTTTSLGP